MDRETVLTVGFTVVAGLNVALGVAWLLRSRHQRGPILWRGQPLAEPRLAACGHLFLGLMFAFGALRDAFEPRSVGDNVLFFAAVAFAVAGLITSVVWLVRRLRRRKTAQPPASP